jgi:hypothetical protein
MAKVKSVKKTISLAETLVDDVQVFADDMGITWTGALSVLVNQALQAMQGMNTLTKMMSEFDKEKLLASFGESLNALGQKN